MNRNTNNKPQGQSKKDSKPDTRHLYNQIGDLEALNASVGARIKELKTFIRLRHAISARRLNPSELHDIRLQLADLQFLQDLTETHIERLKNYALYLDKREKLFGF